MLGRTDIGRKTKGDVVCSEVGTFAAFGMPPVQEGKAVMVAEHGSTARLVSGLCVVNEQQLVFEGTLVQVIIVICGGGRPQESICFSICSC